MANQVLIEKLAEGNLALNHVSRLIDGFHHLVLFGDGRTFSHLARAQHDGFLLALKAFRADEIDPRPDVKRTVFRLLYFWVLEALSGHRVVRKDGSNYIQTGHAAQAHDRPRLPKPSAWAVNDVKGISIITVTRARA